MPADRRPSSGSDPRKRGGGGPRGKDGNRAGARSGGRAQGGRPGGPRRDGAPRRDGGARGGGRPRPDEREPRTESQATYDGPPLPESITGKELDRNVHAQLKGLPEKLAARVARHLAAAGMLIDEDPRTAYEHTLAARARAARVAIVREACGEAAYAAGEYAEALSELRAARRMNGVNDYLPIMADCERALGRPDRALKLAQSPSVPNLPVGLKAEMTIVEAGARRDRGELDAALRTLEQAPLSSTHREAWVARLRYAYADTLLAAGREEEALEWFHRADAADREQATDAAARAEELERKRG